MEYELLIPKEWRLRKKNKAHLVAHWSGQEPRLLCGHQGYLSLSWMERRMLFSTDAKAIAKEVATTGVTLCRTCLAVWNRLYLAEHYGSLEEDIEEAKERYERQLEEIAFREEP